MAKRAVRVKGLAVVTDYAGGFLSAVLKGMQKTLAHALLGKILKTSGLLRTLHLEVTAPPRDRWQHLRRFRAPS